jgi:hypothetical protein
MPDPDAFSSAGSDVTGGISAHDRAHRNLAMNLRLAASFTSPIGTSQAYGSSNGEPVR